MLVFVITAILLSTLATAWVAWDEHQAIHNKNYWLNNCDEY